MKNKIISLCLLLSLGLASCETSFLDEKMTTSLGGGEVYNSVANFEMVLIGVYDCLGTRSLPTISGVTNYMSNYNGGIFILNELATDEMCAVTAGASKNLEIEELDKGIPTSSNSMVEGVYAGAFMMINRANDLIGNIAAAAPNPQLTQFEGEARFLRALGYYNLVSLYGGVPCTETPGADQEDKVIPRATTEQVYDLIFKDLERAYNVLPVSYAGVYGRATKTAAAALLARANLTAATMKKYASITADLKLEGNINSYDWVDTGECFTRARDYAGKVIEVGYKNVTDTLVRLAFEQSFYPYENTPDVIFDVQFAANLAQSEGGWVGYMSGPGSWCWAILSQNIVWNYQPVGAALTNDQRFPNPATKANCDMRKHKTVTNYNYTAGGQLWPPTAANKNYNLGKFAMEQNISYAKQNTPINYTVLRLAEAYLIWAEADAELNDGPTDKAFEMLNYVRRRAADANILPDIVETNLWNDAVVIPITGIIAQDDLEQFRLAVLQERMFELCGESVRRTDLIRSGWIMPILQNVNTKYYTDGTTMYKPRQMKANNIFMPIPSREIGLSNNVVIQNSGY